MAFSEAFVAVTQSRVGLGLGLAGIAILDTACSGPIGEPTALPPAPKSTATEAPSYCDQFPEVVVKTVGTNDTTYDLAVDAMNDNKAGVQNCAHIAIARLGMPGRLDVFTGMQIVNPGPNIPDADKNKVNVSVGDTVCVGTDYQAVVTECFK